MKQKELRKLVRGKGINSPCRKMQLVQHLASFIMRDKAPMDKLTLKKVKLKDLENSSASSLQLFLQDQYKINNLN